MVSFEYICALRSYNIERVANKYKFGEISAALTEGAATGYFGFYGLPFNLAFSFLLFLRATQKIAITYGYDVCNDPREMEIASAVTMESLFPSIEQNAFTMQGMIGKMALASSFTGLKDALKNKTYAEMAGKGGAELFYVQIRALANEAAKKALEKAGADGIEAGILKSFLEQVGKKMTKESGGKAILIAGAIIGGCCDAYNMNRVLKVSNLIYHKRFLFEKEERVKLMY